jgi:hypothetical protein
MKRKILLTISGLVFFFFLGSHFIYSQATFKIPFKFEAGGKDYPAGDYKIALKEDGKISLLKVTGDMEIEVSVIKKLEKSDEPVEPPQIIFDMVANFEPSYTEYVTEYLLAEVWFTDKEGLLVLDGERAEYKKNIKGTAEKK